MIFLHVSTWVLNKVSLETYLQAVPHISEFVQVAMGFNSLCLPIAAGFLLRLRLDKYIVDDRLINFSLKNIFKLTLFLFVLESIKGALAIDFSVFFYWNVLHFIALSFLVIIFLMRISLNFLILTTISVVVFTPLVNFYLIKLNNYYLNNLKFNFALLASIISIVLGILLNLVLKIIFKPKFKLQAFFLVSSTVLFFFFYQRLALQLAMDKFFAYSVVNTVFDIWISNPKTGHYWAFFPGFLLVAFGFVFSHFWVQIKHNKKIYFVVSVISIALVFIFYKFSYHDVLFRMEHRSRALYNKEDTLFDVPAMIGLLGYFSLINLIAERLAVRVKSLHWSSPIYIFSRYILEVYVFHFVIGIHLTRLVVALIPDSTFLLMLFPLVLTILSYLFILIYAYIVEFSKIKVEFKKS
ncbi:MAG: hypothetical protein U0T83_10555 [Bacteriovoracaceae bacterium]